MRTYVALRGGILVDPVLGSCATDVLSGVGPPQIAAGARLRVGTPSGRMPGVDHAPVAPIAREPVLRFMPGPRPAWFVDDVLDTLRGHRYQVESDSNRVAVRLRGEKLRRAIDDELPSEGLIAGGYPVVAVVLSQDLHSPPSCGPGNACDLRAYDERSTPSVCVYIVQNEHGSGRNGRHGRSGCCRRCCRALGPGDASLTNSEISLGRVERILGGGLMSRRCLPLRVTPASSAAPAPPRGRRSPAR